MKFSLVIYKLICNSCQAGYSGRDKLLRVYKCLVFAYNFAVMYFYERDFSNAVEISAKSGGFCISHNKGCIGKRY